MKNLKWFELAFQVTNLNIAYPIPQVFDIILLHLYSLCCSNSYKPRVVIEVYGENLYMIVEHKLEFLRSQSLGYNGRI